MPISSIRPLKPEEIFGKENQSGVKYFKWCRVQYVPGWILLAAFYMELVSLLAHFLLPCFGVSSMG